VHQYGNAEYDFLRTNEYGRPGKFPQGRSNRVGRLTCGSIESNNRLAARLSPIPFKICAIHPTASHRLGIKRARELVLAALRATLNPFSGFPAFAKRLALAKRIVTR
jgi:hypothetical protein